LAPKFAPKSWLIRSGFAVFGLAARLPLSFQYWWGDRLGDLARAAAGKRRRIAARNLELCFPITSPAARQVILRNHFRSLGRMLFESGLAWRGDPKKMNSLRQLVGLDRVAQVRQSGHGVLLLSGHFTTLEIGAHFVASALDQAAGLYREHKDPTLEQLIYQSRKRYVTEMFDRNQARGAIRFLRRGGLLWYAPDQDYRRGSNVFAPFFGLEAATTTSALDLARLGQAKVMLLSQRRRADGTGYDLEISEPLENFPSDDPVADMALVNQRIEKMVRDVPEQYMWVHRRFKRRPFGEADLYQD